MKVIKYLYYALLIVSAIITVVFYAQGCPESMVPLLLNFAYVLVFIALGGMILFPLFFRDGKKMEKSTLVSYGLFVVVILCAVLFSTDAPLEGVQTSVEPSAGDLKFTDGIVMASAILVVIAFAAIIVGNLKNMFSK